MSILETPRLILRPLRLEDAPAIQKHFPHWDIIKNLSTGIPWPYPEDGAAEFVNMMVKHTRNSADECWAITEKGEDVLIGVMDYRVEPNEDGHRGFWLGQHWHGRGYMTEAVTAFHNYAFDQLGVERLYFSNSINNPASGRIKEKTGASFVGFVEFPHHDGTTKTQRWELTAEKWRAFRDRNPAENPEDNS